ncbi:acetyl-CoA carboxylase biotin carboxyl carrier protein subunit [Allomuricauda sp. SCSIO 65647]|uniref:acetyl-CoA carboxylase biotin carboxyl carrier protein subunit n=1 Tax=Allomuricauda sp. SCSIO 65647 TaxID=2908843 RepID=UPI001F250467|nr:acetyl-CoA carboxylase biotin carboxyl carrier protein subunit [Muricauda sp. SCSIO 65647]UJH67880.1 acetyl-CoA carboxylase biotin carboxyl carrier protein subunit [Muricauda sp. SCSIO 65647]
MGKPHMLKVNGQYEFELSESDLSELDMAKTGDRTYHLLHQNQSYHLTIESEDFDTKNYGIRVNGSSYNVTVETPLNALIKDMGFALNAGNRVANIEAPMPGLILEISAKEGEEVKEGDNLLILEAMKMENVITSPRDGTIKKITVKKGQAVEKKHILITFEE